MKIIDIAKKIRAHVTRKVISKSSYSLAPISKKYGFDRGEPIDRFWIEEFLQSHKSQVTGRCIEITDNSYTQQFGTNVTKSDVLDINPKNKKANIIGDLRNLKNIRANTYDCVILTHVIGIVDDVSAVASECYRILKPGGSLLLTSSCFSPDFDQKGFWRFTPRSIEYIFGKYFLSSKMQLKTYGNVLAGQAFWVGLAQEDLSPKQIKYNDPTFPCIVTLAAIK